jgi:Pentapeptide repeats (9 copies)
MAYDQDFFLALAVKGKEAWNAWRRDPANKDVHVNFRGIDFSEAPRDKIDFSGFEFGDYADFSGCRWQNRAFFDEANFGHGVRFNDATFHNRAYFRAATFGHFADFSNAIFYEVASFDCATFGSGASFGSGSFDGTSVILTRARFGSLADFSGATFNPMASFDSTVFQGPVDFSGLSEALFAEKLERSLGPPDEKTAQARKALEARHRSSWKRHGCEPDRFLDISFAGARFDGEAIFSGRSFERAANFTQARFYHPPDFDGVTNAARIDFTGAYIGFARPGRLVHWTPDTKVPLRLRALRKITEETKNHDLERDLYIEERKAERGVYLRHRWDELRKAPEDLKKKLEDITNQKKHAWLEWRLQRRARNAHLLGIAVKIARLVVHILWIAVMGLYWALADYGRSFMRPFAWLIASGFFFYWRYLDVLARLMAKAPDVDKYRQAVVMVALGNAVPFVGPLTLDAEIKKFLFCPLGNCPGPLIPPEGYQLLVVGQNLFSITCVFFIGLALRNYFRIK